MSGLGIHHDDSNRATSEDNEGVDLDSLMEFLHPNTEIGAVIKDDASSKQSESSNAADGGGVTSQSQISNVVYSNTGGDPMNRAAPLFEAANPNDNGANATARIVADLDGKRASAGESPSIETRMKPGDSISAGPTTAMAAPVEEEKEKVEHSPRADPPALAPDDHFFDKDNEKVYSADQQNQKKEGDVILTVTTSSYGVATETKSSGTESVSLPISNTGVAAVAAPSDESLRRDMMAGVGAVDVIDKTPTDEGANIAAAVAALKARNEEASVGTVDVIDKTPTDEGANIAAAVAALKARNEEASVGTVDVIDKKPTDEGANIAAAAAALKARNVERQKMEEQQKAEEEEQQKAALLQARQQQEQTRHVELLRQKQRQKQQEAQRLLQEAEQFQKEAETLEKLQRLQLEKEELKRTHVAQQDAVATLRGQIQHATTTATTRQQQQQTGQGQVQRQKQQQQHTGNADAISGPTASSYSPHQSSSLSYPYSDYSSEQQSLSALRMRNTQNNSIMKRRSPRRRSSHSEVDTTIDMESQQSHDGRKSEKVSSLSRLLAKGRATTTGNNSLVSTRNLLHKIIMNVLTNEDDETLGRDDTETHILLITLLVEAIIGILLAFAAITFTLFLYNHFVPHLPTAHNFRKAAFALMNDDETLKDFEKNAGLKFVEMREYTSIVREIEEATNKTKTGEIAVRTRSEYIAEMKDEIETNQYAVKIPEMVSSLELDRFCNVCIWSVSQNVNCIQRVGALKEKYKIPKYQAMLSAMEKKSCWKSTEQAKEERELKEKVDKLMKNWDESQKDFCPECEWDTNMSCISRVAYLHTTYGASLDEGKAKTMAQTKTCTNSFQEEDTEKLARFCSECEWGNKSSCGQRVEYMVYTYKNTERMAKLSAMQKPSCVLSKKE